MIFSIADLQPTEDGYSPEEGGEEDDAAIYPIRVSLTITKVRVSCSYRVVSFKTVLRTMDLVPSASIQLCKMGHLLLNIFHFTRMGNSAQN